MSCSVAKSTEHHDYVRSKYYSFRQKTKKQKIIFNFNLSIMNHFCSNACLERSEQINGDVNEEMYVEFLNFVIQLIWMPR